MGQYMSGVGNGWTIGMAIMQTDGAGICIAINIKTNTLYIANKQSKNSNWIQAKITTG